LFFLVFLVFLVLLLLLLLPLWVYLVLIPMTCVRMLSRNLRSEARVAKDAKDLGKIQ
jgi:Flp pilus assembly protein TadB